MSDKRNTYSTVKIIENNDARVVVMWRYGLVDNFNNFAFQDPETGWVMGRRNLLYISRYDGNSKRCSLFKCS